MAQPSVDNERATDNNGNWSKPCCLCVYGIAKQNQAEVKESPLTGIHECNRGLNFTLGKFNRTNNLNLPTLKAITAEQNPNLYQWQPFGSSVVTRSVAQTKRGEYLNQTTKLSSEYFEKLATAIRAPTTSLKQTTKTNYRCNWHMWLAHVISTSFIF